MGQIFLAFLEYPNFILRIGSENLVLNQKTKIAAISQFLCSTSKDQLSWEGHKHLEKYPTCFDATELKQLFCQNKWEIFSNFVAFS